MFAVGFFLMYIANAFILFAGLTFLGLILIHIQGLVDGPAAALPMLFVTFLAATIFAFPVTLFWIDKYRKK